MGFINQLITGGHHPEGAKLILRYVKQLGDVSQRMRNKKKNMANEIANFTGKRNMWISVLQLRRDLSYFVATLAFNKFIIWLAIGISSRDNMNTPLNMERTTRPGRRVPQVTIKHPVVIGSTVSHSRLVACRIEHISGKHGKGSSTIGWALFKMPPNLHYH